MNNVSDTVAQLRQLSAAELIASGDKSLREHLAAQAVVAHQKHGPLTFDKLEPFLQDPDCLRYPTRLVFEFGEMAMHQFAQPELDSRDLDRNGRVLYLRPLLRERPDLVVHAVAYMIPVINYGNVATDEHCLIYGATLLGLMAEEFYLKICEVADFVGAETRFPTACGGSG